MKYLFRKFNNLTRGAIRSVLGNPNKYDKEVARLAGIPRYNETTTYLLDSPFHIPDTASFIASWREIFKEEIYRFNPTNNSPRILDCGANVGVSSLYFHRNYPNARITAFEPDPKIFSYLSRNLTNANATSVELIAKAVWTSETTIHFKSEGSDSGRIDSDEDSSTISIPTVRLADYLNEYIDLLKIDIEGAETDVILDVKPLLGNVQNIFVEYHSFEDRPQNLHLLIQALIESGFRIQIQTVSNNPNPFIKINSYLKMDMQLNIFGVRNN